MFKIDYVLVNSEGKTISAQLTSLDDGQTRILPVQSLIGMQFDNAIVTKNGVIRAKRGYILERKAYRVFYIMNKDKIVAEFDESMKCKVRGQFPKGYISLKGWLESRQVFECAKDGHAFYLSIGIRNVFDFIDMTNCVSLRDTYWVKPASSPLTWDCVSPFRNDYSDVVSIYALEGYLLGRDTKYIAPELGTCGSFPHAWAYNDGNISFIKAGSKFSLGGINSGQEPYSEYFASIICDYLEFNHIKYDIRNHERCDNQVDVVTECKLYTSEEYGSITASRLGLKDYDEVLNYCSKLGKKSLTNCLNMFFLDCLLLNIDRHLGNIEFYISNETQQVVGLIPIFDNNCSMLPRFVESTDTFVRTDYITASGMLFEKLFRLVERHRSYRKQLQKLKRLKLQKPNRVAMTDSRIDFLNKFLQMQVNYLLSIS